VIEGDGRSRAVAHEVVGTRQVPAARRREDREGVDVLREIADRRPRARRQPVPRQVEGGHRVAAVDEEADQPGEHSGMVVVAVQHDDRAARLRGNEDVTGETMLPRLDDAEVMGRRGDAQAVVLEVDRGRRARLLSREREERGQRSVRRRRQAADGGRQLVPSFGQGAARQQESRGEDEMRTGRDVRHRPWRAYRADGRVCNNPSPGAFSKTADRPRRPRRS